MEEHVKVCAGEGGKGTRAVHDTDVEVTLVSK